MTHVLLISSHKVAPASDVLRNTRGFPDFVQRASVWQQSGSARTQGESWSGARSRASVGGRSTVQFNSWPTDRFLACAGIHIGFFSYLCPLTIHAILLMDKKEKIEHKTQRMSMRGNVFCLDVVYSRMVGRRGFGFKKVKLILTFLYPKHG